MAQDEHYLKKELYERIGKERNVFDFLQEAALDGIWYWDLENPEHEWMSDKFWRVLGYDSKEKQHLVSEWQSIMFQDDLKAAKKVIQQHIDGHNQNFDVIVRYHHKNGSTVWIRCRGIAIRDENGQARRLLGAHTNITSLMHAHQEVHTLKNEYETVFNGSQDALFLIKVHAHKDFTFVRNNLAHQRKTGVTLDMIEGKSPTELLGVDAAQAVINHYQRCVEHRDVISYEETLDLPAGKRIWSTTLTPVFSDDTITHIVGSAIDITANKRLEKELAYQANHDALTKLPNRAFLTKHMEAMTAKNEAFTFMFLDLNDFKPINDAYGHAAGDEVLRHIAQRIKKLSQNKDFLARLGGDEFVVIKHGQYKQEEIKQCITRLKTAIEQPVIYHQQTIHLSVSIGHAVFPQDGLHYDDLSQKADERMYKHKKRTR